MRQGERRRRGEEDETRKEVKIQAKTWRKKRRRDKRRCEKMGRDKSRQDGFLLYFILMVS